MVLANHPEGISDLEVSQVLSILMEHEDEPICCLASTQCEVNLVEDVTPVVLVIIVPSGVHHAGLEHDKSWSNLGDGFQLILHTQKSEASAIDVVHFVYIIILLLN